MTKRNICIDSVQPRDAMRVLITTESGIGTVVNMKKESFELLFSIEAKEGLYLEVDLDVKDVTAEKRKEVRELQHKLGLR
jgi:hypothetical protein